VNGISRWSFRELNLVTELTEVIQVRAGKEENGQDFEKFFPDFLWTIRDFDLQLEHKGKKITEDQYLFFVIKSFTGKSKRAKEHNSPRRCIKKYFPSRKCIIFPQPTQSRNLGNLESISERSLDQEFLMVTEKFCSYVYQKAKPKTFQGHLVDSKLFGTFLKVYIDCIHSGNVPCLESTYRTLAERENKKAAEEAVKYYRESMDKIQFPTESIFELSEYHRNYEKEAIDVYMRRSITGSERSFKELMVHVLLNKSGTFHLNYYWKANSSVPSTLEVHRKRQEKHISTTTLVNGHNLRKTLLDEAEKKYLSIPRKGPKAEEMLKEFDAMKSNERNILQMDQSLSKKQKEVTAEERKVIKREKKAKAERQNKEALERLSLDLTKTYEENLQKMKNKIEEDHEILKQDYEAILARRLIHQRELLNEGFQAEAEKLQKEIEDLREESQKLKEGTDS
uniref:GB1/RHD3-type G domain-containing protein n=1 Tax=Latimeria chalumnae TaxID=7897 RepID=H3A9Q8_LATCH